MKTIYRGDDNKNRFLIDRTSRTIPTCLNDTDVDAEMLERSCRCVEIFIDHPEEKPFFCPHSESYFAHDPYTGWEPYHTGDDPIADRKIKEIADKWGIEL